MLVFTIQNAVLVSLFQVVTITFGIAAAATTYKVLDQAEVPPPLATVFLMHYGLVLFSLPLGWLVAALRLRRQSEVPDSYKTLAFVAGLLLALVLVLFVGYAVIRPWTLSSVLLAKPGIEP